uniref:Uncharacterized protein n=1 Tax=Amphilophus citrinellus TaxID=61819 RepID=A0A3Q0SGK0_AMPCI
MQNGGAGKQVSEILVTQLGLKENPLVFVVVFMLGEAAELQGVQLLGDLLRPATVDQLPQLEWSPVCRRTHTHTYISNHIHIVQHYEADQKIISRLFSLLFATFVGVILAHRTL